MRVFNFEFRAKEGEADNKVKMYAAVFGSKSEFLDGYYEVVEPGAFKDALTTSDVRCLLNHDPNYVLGRNKAKTLDLREDEKGLLCEVEFPDTTYAKDLRVSMERGDISQCSFAFEVEKEEYKYIKPDGEPKGFWVRTIQKVKRMYDVSIVTYPAYPDTSIALRSLQQHKEKLNPPPGPSNDSADWDKYIQAARSFVAIS